MHAAARRVLVALGLVVTVPFALLVLLNVFLNTWLPVLLNQQPERLRMTWTAAWTWDARHVEVEGYTLRVQGPVDQWWLSVERAELDVELLPLLERRFQARGLFADGVTLRYRTRVDAPPAPNVPPAEYVEGRTAPIPGLENPPLERPEDLYPPPAEPWLVAFEDVDVRGVQEVWLGDYRFVGQAAGHGELIITPGASLDVSDVTFEVLEGGVLYDDLPILSDLVLDVEGSLEGVDPLRDAGVGILRHLDATLHLGGLIDDLSHVDIFLGEAPWVGISGGTGSLEAVLDVEDGVLGPASTAQAVVSNLTARLGTYSVVGDGRVNVTLARGARLAAVLETFAVYQGGGSPLVKGRGFRLDAKTAALQLYAAPAGFAATATLPRSQVPSLARFSHYLPANVGLQVLGGHATVAGRAHVEEDGDHVSGTVEFDARDVELLYAGIPVTGNVNLKGNVRRGSLDDSRYDIGGSAFGVERVSVDGKPPTWWATLDVREGRVHAGAKTFLTARSDFGCSDSSPFMRVAVRDRKVAPWIEKLLLLKGLRGEAVASFGQTSVTVDHMQVNAPNAELHFHLSQDRDRLDALFFARLGLLGVATHVAGDRYTVQLLDAKRWFHSRLAAAGTPEPMTSMQGKVTEARDQRADHRQGLKIFGKDLRKLLRGKRGAVAETAPEGKR